MNIIAKDASKFCTKPVKCVKSFLVIQVNIQHGFLVEMIFENPKDINQQINLEEFSKTIKAMGRESKIKNYSMEITLTT
jgi:hypothetical protein